MLWVVRAGSYLCASLCKHFKFYRTNPYWRGSIDHSYHTHTHSDTSTHMCTRAHTRFRFISGCLFNVLSKHSVLRKHILQTAPPTPHRTSSLCIFSIHCYFSFKDLDDKRTNGQTVRFAIRVNWSACIPWRGHNVFSSHMLQFPSGV